MKTNFDLVFVATIVQNASLISYIIKHISEISRGLEIQDLDWSRQLSLCELLNIISLPKGYNKRIGTKGFLFRSFMTSLQSLKQL